ncbi:MAG TPA: LuxR C-terminal-related transcriptional regulator [Actinomycetales bacterium]|jgi:LuxR family maltose regulon positive regulatory protein|nr:LuxR C-terminal-related transcriptional regulator [Actinomycetales bacterium]
MEVLTTKVHVPVSRRALVVRPRLLEDLASIGPWLPRLVLIAAPAGSGKTTLLSQWLTSAVAPAIRVAWLSLDEADNDLRRFLTHLVVAVQAGVPVAVDDLEALLEYGGEAPTDTLLTALVNDLDEVDGTTVLALDDYHVIEDGRVHDAVAFLLEHLPPQATIAMTTRADPPLPLPRMRARAELVEIRGADLRFTRGEADTFLNHVMGLDLSPDQVAALDTRTEGWAAGLQLAGLSMRGRDGAAGFVDAFTGSHRFVLDYLVEEVLDHQPDDMRRFLLDTAVLERMTGPLCDALTGSSDGRARLEQLDRANLFVIPLDDQREWYRYHHLFADTLRARLTAEHPARAHGLHRAASAWYAEHGLFEEAIGHANSAGDTETAADLIEAVLPEARRLRRDRLLAGWLRALPDDVIRQRPVLSTQSAWMSLVAGDLDGLEARLRDAEQALKAAPARRRSSRGGDDAIRTLPAWIAIYRASAAQARGDAAATAAHARAALELAAPEDHFARGGAAGFLGLAAWADGDLQPAVDTFTLAVESLGAAGNVADAVGSTIVLADMWQARGSPAKAQQLCEQALKSAETRRGLPLSITGDLHVGLADVLREHGDLDAAQAHLTVAQALGEAASLPENRHRWHLVRAGLQRAHGDLHGAVTELEEALAVYLPGFFPDVRPIPAALARVHIAQGRLADAWAWARAHHVSAAGDLTYLAEFDHLTLARLLIAQHRADGRPALLDEVISLLERLLASARGGGRGSSVIDAHLLAALAHDARGERDVSLERLDQALAVAVPAGYVRLFLDEGTPMKVLLRAAEQRPGSTEHARTVLRTAAAGTKTPSAAPAAIEPLSDREREVLRLLATSLTGPQISRQLFMTINTFRTHTRHIFTKLDVQTRRAAVARAAELDLL